MWNTWVQLIVGIFFVNETQLGKKIGTRTHLEYFEISERKMRSDIAKFILYFVKFSFICAKLSLNFVILTSACAEMIWKMSISQDNEMWAIQIWINFNRLRICESV